MKEIVFRAAKRLELEVVLVSNQWLSAPPGNPLVAAVRVKGGLDVADRYIAENAEPGDVAITADIPLAAKLVEKGVTAIDPRGDEYTEENVSDRLAFRDLMDGSPAAARGGGPRARPSPETVSTRPLEEDFLGRLDERHQVSVAVCLQS